jgi:predicted Zn-dependent protease
LEAQDVFERARSRHASGDVEDLPAETVPVLLSPESTIELFDLLNRVALSAAAYSGGTSFLREHLGVQVFDRAICLRDDGTNPDGLPFPFDLEGTVKFPVDLIAQGTPKTPALDQRQAAQLGLPPTAHSITGNDARAQNLFLLPGELSEPDLMREVGDGIWIGSLDHLECTDPLRVRIRAHARGVRRIRNGLLGPAIPDLIWEDSLLRILSNVNKLSRDPVRRFAHTGILGGICAPALAITDATGFSPAGEKL